MDGQHFEGDERKLRFRVGWFAPPGEAVYPPECLRELRDASGVESLSWQPRE